ncbi:HupE/UreJ family protein [Bacillus sp. S3]|uniref:HupE/UreJ family protein n=1 Tax=Bacillus sp. S3 TaxID=486398 RepID=UPI00118BDFBB|nr:HupE/UreJ family protein [Bacillus sp. S3]QCJ41631.1 HupE/UreJ family protein [Bacillus sp. S3]
MTFFDKFRLEVRHLTLILLSVIVFSCLSFPNNTFAHAYSVSYTKITMDNKNTEVVFSLDTLSVLELIPAIDKNKNFILDQSEIKENTHHLEELITEGLTLDKDNIEQTPTIKKMEIIKKENKEFFSITMMFPAFAPGETFIFNDGFYYHDTGTNYVNLVSASYMGEKSEAALEGKNRTWTMLITEVQQEQQIGEGQTVQPSAEPKKTEEAHPVKTTTSSSWFSFLKLGMNHILSGYDHLLFLLSLLIARQTFKQLAATITAFTIAHSITLTLTVLGIINIPASFVEPAIALSICYVSLENIFRKKINYRWAITFVFGLIHGMGFADILKEMNIPKSSLAADLASFNIGIEMIQLAIVILLLPLLSILYRSKYSRKAIVTFSIIAFLLGGIWLIERLAA